MDIAPLQSQQIQFIRDALNALEHSVDRSSRKQFKALTERLDGWAAKIAVIGQVKAGKSTFLNAFIHQPDFLPSDVNPWTSVVTNIRINVPVDPEFGASFEFFSNDDWQEIIDGSDKIRKLTEQLLPGFDSAVLKQQSEQMRDRAQRRLGKHFNALLGTRHEYDFVSGDLLKRYVCAGPGSDDGLGRESLGRYAAITKVANVYSRQPEYKVPTIITDTPGVNDPFLVRDEFTCRSLDKSDVFVVVLSAHQALTDVDIALIRILSQQDGKDVVIFVNRIDELDNYDRDVQRVVDDVTLRLCEAIPEIEFTILAGSAYLAEIALRTDDEAVEERDRLDTPKLADYLRDAFGEVPEDQIDRLLMASGLNRVKETLSTIIDNGSGCQQLDQLLEDIRAEVGGVQFVARRERESIQSQIQEAGNRQPGDSLKALEAEVETIEAVFADLSETAETASTEIDRIVTSSGLKLELDLNSAVESFLDGFRNELAATVQQDAAAANGSLELDLAPLSATLERSVQTRFDWARDEMDGHLQICLELCADRLSEVSKDRFDHITLQDLPFDTFTSTLALARKTLKFDLVTERSWAFWKKKSVNVDKTVEALKAIAAAEMRPAMEKILKAFREAQAERMEAGDNRVRVMLRGVESMVDERRARFRKDQRQQQALAADADKREQVVKRLQSRLEVLERRLQDLAAIDSSLNAAILSEAA